MPDWQGNKALRRGYAKGGSRISEQKPLKNSVTIQHRAANYRLDDMWRGKQTTL